MTFYKNKTHCIKQWPVSYSTQAELWSWSFSGEVYGPTGSGSNPSCVECHKIVTSGWSTATQRQKNTCTGNLQPLYVELGRCLVLKMSRSAEKSHTLRFRETRMQFSEGWPVTLSAATLSFNLHLNHWQMWHWFTEVFNSLRPENPHRFKCKRNNISLIFAQWCQQVGAMRGPFIIPATTPESRDVVLYLDTALEVETHWCQWKLLSYDFQLLFTSLAVNNWVVQIRKRASCIPTWSHILSVKSEKVISNFWKTLVAFHPFFWYTRLKHHSHKHKLSSSATINAQ